MFFESLEGRAMMVADAINDAGTTNENTVLTTVLPGTTASLLANDTGTGLTVVGFSGTSVQGATVSVAAGGTFSYNPLTSTSLQALGNAQNLVDTFSYVISEGAPTNGFQVKTYNSGGQGDLASVDAFLAAPPATLANVTTPTINLFQTDTTNQHFIGAGTASPFDDEIPVPGFGVGVDANNYIVEAVGSIYVPAPGRYTFSVNSDDGFGLAITGGANLLSVYGAISGTSTLGVNGRMVYTTGRGSSDTFGVWDFPTAGVYPLRLVNWEGGGGSSVEMFAARGEFPGTTFATAQNAGAQWRLVGDTFDANGLRVFSPATSVDAATVSVTVTGVNAAPVGVSNAYATNEDTALVVPAILEPLGMNVLVYDGTDAGIGSADTARNSSTTGAPVNPPNASSTTLIADLGTNGDGSFPGQGTVPPPGGGDNYAVFLTGVLRVNNASNPGNLWTFGTFADDASRIRIDLNRDGILQGALQTLGGETVALNTGCCGVSLGTPVAIPNGDYLFEAVFTEGGGGDYGEFFYAPGNPGFSITNYSLIGDASKGITSYTTVARPGVLGNDTDEELTTNGGTQTLTVTQLNGAAALTGPSTMGATVTMLATGGFTYNPTGSAALQALAVGQTVVDTFTYTASDGTLTTAATTVSITVTGRNDAPIANNNNYTTNENTALVTTDQDAAPRNQQGDTTPAITNDDSVLVNDIEVDNTDVFEVVSTRAVFPGMNVAVWNTQAGDAGYGNFAGADFNRDRRAPNFSGTLALADVIGQGGGHFPNDTVLPGTANNTENYAVYITGILRVTTAGQYTFGTFSDDNSRIKIDLNQNGTLNDDANVATQGGCCGDVFGTATLAVGDYQFEAMYTEGGGGDYGEFFYSPGNLTTFGPTFKILGDGSSGISTFRPVVSTLSGTLGVLGNGSATFTSNLGATVTMNDNGTFNYNPTGSATLQALAVGQTAIDSFTYTATDNQTIFTPGALNYGVWNQQAGETIAGTFATADTVRGSRAANFTGTMAQADVYGNNNAGHYPINTVLPGTVNNTENYAVYINGVLRVTVAGTYTFGTLSDDNSRIRIDLNQDGNVNNDGTVVTQGGCCGDVFGQATLAVGDYAFEAMYTEGGGGDMGEFFYAPGALNAFSAAFKLIGDNTGPILGGSMQPTRVTATVNVTVSGLNDNPTANPDNYTTSENTVLTVPASVVTGMNVLVYDGTDNTIGSADFYRHSSVNGQVVIPPDATGTIALADLGTSGDGAFPGQSGVPAPGGGDGYAVFLTGVMRINNANNPGNMWTFGTFADDASRIRIDLDRDGVIEGALQTLGGETVALNLGCCGVSLGGAVNIPDGDYAFELVFTEGGGGDYGEFFYAPGNPVFTTANYALLGNPAKGITTYSTFSGLMANDRDIDTGDTISVNTATIISANGATVTPLANGSFSYNPATSQAAQLLINGQTLTDSFVYTLLDNNGGSSTGTVTVVVTGVSDPVNDIYSVNEDNPPPPTTIDLTVPAGTGLLANDTIPGNPALEVIRVQGLTLSGAQGTVGDGSITTATTAGGQIVVQDTGAFTYDQLGVFNSLPQGGTATDTFTYRMAGAPDFIPGLTYQVYNTQAGDFGYGTFAGADKNRIVRAPNATGTVNVADIIGQPGGHFTVDNILPGTANNTEQYAVYLNGWLRVTVAGVYTFGTFSDDNSRIKIDLNQNGTLADDANVATQGGCCGDVFGQATLAVGDYQFEAMYTEGGGGDYGEFFYAPGSLGAFSAAFRVLGDNSGPVLAGQSRAPNTTLTATINIFGQNDAPTANANGPYSINLGQNLAVSAVGSADVDTGTVLSYGWDLNLDNVNDFTTTSQNATIPWSVLQSVTPPMGAGSYTIRLNVFDGFVTTQATAALTISDTFVYNPTQDGVADGYLLILNPAQTIIEIRDTATNALLVSAPKAGTNLVTFNGTNDNDTLTIDWTNTTPIPALNGVTFTGGAGTNGLVLRNGTVTTVTENYVTDNNGSTNIDGRIVNYTGLTPITDTLTAANRIFNFTGGNETIALQNVVAGTSLLIDSTLGAATTFNKPTDSTTINPLTGSADTLNITSATLVGNFTVAGTDGNDNVNVNGAVAVTAGATLPGLVSITGNAIAFNAGSITTVNNVNLTAAGAITTSTAAVDVAAINLVAAAATGIALDTTVTNLTSTVSGAGAITLRETDAVTLLNVTTVNSAITFSTLAAGNVTVENLNSGTQNTSMTLFDGNLVSGAADAGVADIVANQLTLQLNTSGPAHFIGVSAASRLEIDVNQLQANIATGSGSSAWIVNTAGNMTMTNSSLGATGTTVFDVLVQNGSLLNVFDGTGDARAVQVILAVTGAGSTIGASAVAPFEVNAATASTVALVSASTAGGANDHIWLRDVADNFPIGVINAGLADVFLSSTTGSIIDDANDSVLDITGGRLVMSSIASGGIGVTNGNLETQVGSLEATGGTLGVFIANTGNLVIGGISAAVGVSATGGDLTVSTAGSLTINENVTATGAGDDVTLSTIDAAAVGQDITVAAGVSISSAAASVTLSSGDNVTLTATSPISAATTITINIDSGNADPVGASLTIPSGAVLTGTSATFNAASPGAGTDADIFSFAPQLTTPIVVNAFNPILAPGDVLNLSLVGTTGNTLAIDGVNDGTYTFTNRASVEYNSIESVNAVGGSYDLILNMAGFGAPGNFTVRRSAPAVGTNLEIVNNTTATIVFTGDLALIASFRANGTTGNDNLTIDDVNGLVTFDPLLTPTAVFPNNPIGVGTPRLLFDGDLGADSLNFNLNEAGTTQTYAIGNGAGAGAGEGEVNTTNTAGRTLVAYFVNLGNDGSQINRTGTAVGALNVVGDNTANVINVTANGTETRVNPPGFTPFDFSGNNYSSINVNGLAGDDTLDLQGIGTGQTNGTPFFLNGGTENDLVRVSNTSGTTSSVTLNGNAGDDVFQLFDAAFTVDNITTQILVDGTDGNVANNTDTLQIVDRGDLTADNVLISAVNPGSSADYGVDGINGTAGIDVILRNIDVLEYTGTSANDVIDTRLVSTAPPHDLSVVTVNGWLGADQFLLFTSDQAGGSGAGVTPNGVASGIATVNLNGDAPGNPNAGDGNDVFGQTGPGIVGTGSGNVGLAVPDTVRGIRPSVSTGIIINGGQPTGPALPTQDTVGDVLNLDVSGLPGGSALILPTLSGTVATTGFQPLNFTQIEDINLIINNQLVNVQMGDVFVRGTAGVDLIQFMRASTTADQNRTRTRVNTLVVDYTLTGKTVTYAAGSDDYVTQSNVIRPMEAYGEDGDDYISGGTGNDFLVGGLGSDQINASSGDNIVWGDNASVPSDPTPQDLAIGGHDTLSALGGTDVFYGGGGNDSVSAGGGNDYAYGGQGDDTLGGDAGDDRLYGGLGNDNISGGAGNDLLSGGAGDDQANGDSGNDVLFGGTGADTIGGGDGNDLIVSGSVANENSSFTSVASTATYNAVTYSNPVDNDAALLTLLATWSASSSRTGLGAITHDGQDDDLFGFTGDDDFCWETVDVLDDFPAIAPADYNGFGMGTDERFGPTA